MSDLKPLPPVNSFMQSREVVASLLHAQYTIILEHLQAVAHPRGTSTSSGTPEGHRARGTGFVPNIIFLYHKSFETK